MTSEIVPPVSRATVTIKDVAAEAGVSVATASRVLSGSSATSNASREAVRGAATRLGFRPNSQARALRSARTASIGLLIPDIRNEYFAELAHSVERHARERGLVTLISAADESYEMQFELVEMFLSHNVDGLLVVPQGQPLAGSPVAMTQRSSRGRQQQPSAASDEITPGVIERIMASGTPLVLVDRDAADQTISSVTADTAGLDAAVAHLAYAGHERIALIAGPSCQSTGRERRASFEAALLRAGLNPDPELIVEGDFRAESGARCVRELWRGRADESNAVRSSTVTTRPTAVVIADGPMTVGALGQLHELGIQVPEQLSVIGYDDLAAFRLTRPALSTVRHDVHEMGRIAVELLGDVMLRKPSRRVRLSSQLVCRASVGPPWNGPTSHRQAADMPTQGDRTEPTHPMTTGAGS